MRSIECDMKPLMKFICFLKLHISGTILNSLTLVYLFHKEDEDWDRFTDKKLLNISLFGGTVLLYVYFGYHGLKS